MSTPRISIAKLKHIMRGGAIVYVCAATASMYDNSDPERMREALAAASDLFTEATQELERIAKAVDAIQNSRVSP